ncbi:NAD-dependent protein deacylase [Chitinophaga caeni]|uniref:protein acetyllysine N-acetyltransferase n=1 Tax=Chitinophaga caeni TaxID=2029983 RepID=A0A291QWS6_9BACT|nr:Sir2 family NAD-dependent protein deacetylase [Chitinophaga caeni]ATL48395.1 NAD-dependent protein deacylase [Chitinophaga caeni]
MDRKPKLVVLTGAGISAESGLKTFRDSGGLWEGYDIEEVATPEAWERNPKLVLEFYNLRRDEVRKAQPNRAHLALASLENEFDITIITQNIDDLHERAGSSQVLHLHGLINKMRSDLDVHRLYDVGEKISIGDLAPDGGQFRPHVVWFGEAVPMMGTSMQVVQEADIFLLVGTSLNVYPAAGLIHYIPKTAHKFVIDKQVPKIGDELGFTIIEAPATEGIEDFLDYIKML